MCGEVKVKNIAKNGRVKELHQMKFWPRKSTKAGGLESQVDISQCPDQAWITRRDGRALCRALRGSYFLGAMLQLLALGEAPFADGKFVIGAVVPVCSGVVAVIYLFSDEMDVATISITIAVFPLLRYNTAHCIEVEVAFMNSTEDRHHMRALYDITERLLHLQAAHDMNKVIGGRIQDYGRSDNRFSASVRQAATRADAIFGRGVIRRGRTPGFLIAGNTSLTLVIAESNFLTGRDVIFTCKTVASMEELLPLVDELTATCGVPTASLLQEASSRIGGLDIVLNRGTWNACGIDSEAKRTFLGNWARRNDVVLVTLGECRCSFTCDEQQHEVSPTLMLAGDPWIIAAATTIRVLGADDTFGGVAVAIRADVLARLVCGRFASFNKMICRSKAVAGVDTDAVSISSVKARDILAYVAAVRWGASFDVGLYLPPCALTQEDVDEPYAAETFAPSAEATWTEITHYGAYHPPLALIEEAHLSVTPVVPVNFPKPYGCIKVRVDLSSPGAGVKLSERAEKLFSTKPLTEEFTKNILAVYRTWESAALDSNCFEIKAIPQVPHRARSELEVQAETLRQALDAHRSTLLPVARHKDGDYAHFYRLQEVKKTLFGASKGDPAPTLTRLVIKKQEYCGADNVARAVLLHN
eukprot:g17819.t1